MQSVHASTSQQHANVHGLVSKLNHVLSIFLFSKRQRKGDEMTVNREESLVKGENSTPGALYHHVHAKRFLLWRVPVSNTCFNHSQSSMYHDRVHYMAAWNACVIKNHLRVIWNVHMLLFQGIHGNGKSQQCASLCCTRSTSTASCQQ